MRAKNTIVIVIAVSLLFVSVLSSCTGVLRGPLTSGEKAFLAGLRGEIVYVHTDDRHDNIYKINANGTDKKLLLNTDSPEHHFRCSSPLWSEDGTKIYFTAYINSEFKIFVMDSNGGNVELAEKPDIIPSPVCVTSRAPDIYINKGNVFWQDAAGQTHQVFHYPFHAEFDTASRFASWSPDKKYIIFVTALHNIMVVNREGTMAVKVTDGEDPDWKY